MPLAVSGGIAHPNRDGYAVIGAALRDRMRAGVHGPLHARQRAGDDHERDGLRVLGGAERSGAGAAELRLLASGPRAAPQRQRHVNLPNQPTSARPALRDGEHDVRADRPVLRDRARVRAAVAQRRRAGCSPTTSSLPVSTFVPAQAGGPDRRRQGAEGACSSRRPASRSAGSTRTRSRRTTRGARSSGWSAAAPTIEQIGAGTVHDGRGSTACRTARRYSITVRACNDGGRCSATLGPVSETADQGESPLTQPSILQGIEIAVEGVPCLNTPVPFDPSFGPGTPGFEDPTPTSSRVHRRAVRGSAAAWRARAGGTSTCGGAIPAAGASLRDVTVQFVGRRGVLATLRFDQNRNRLTLLRRGSRRSLTAGRAGRLKVGGITSAARRRGVQRLGPGGRRRADALRGHRAARGPGSRSGPSDDSGREQPVVRRRDGRR